MDHVLLYAEPAQDARQVEGGWKSLDKLGVSVAVLYEWKLNRYLVFGPNDLNQLRTRLVQADWVSGHNLLRLTYPLVFGQDWNEFRMGSIYRPLSARTNDLVQRVLLGMGLQPDMVDGGGDAWSLAVMAKGTIGRFPVSTGMEAPTAHQQGNWPAVVSLALDAASVAVELVEFVERFGYVVNAQSKAQVDLRGAGVRSPLQDAGFLGTLKPTGIGS